MAVKERIAALIAPLKSEEAALIEQRDAKQAELAEILEELRQVQRMLRVADPESYASQKEDGKNGGPSEETVERIFRVMWAEPAKTWTIAEVAGKTGLHSTSVSGAIQVLRQRGDVQNKGRMPKAPGAMGAAPLGFKIAETATPPGAEKKKPLGGGKSNIRKMVSAEKLDRVRKAMQAEPDRIWTRADVAEKVGFHRAQVDFAVRILAEDGELEALPREHGNQTTQYKVVSNGG
jgi:hypothetical protein